MRWSAVCSLVLLATVMGSHPTRGGELRPADSLTVGECVVMARQLAPAVRAAGLDRAAARGDSSAAAVNARPTVALLGEVYVAPEGLYDPALTNLGDYELRLGLDWTASDGGRLARARARGGLDLRAADQRAALEIRDAGLEAARLAFQALRLEEEAEAQRQTLDWLDRLARLVRAGVSAGTRSPSDSTRVDLERDAVTSALETALLDARTTALDLGRLLGLPGDSLGVIESEPLGDRGPAEADSTRLLALVDRFPEVQLSRTLAARSQLDLLDARRAKSPTVTVSLDAGLWGADLTHLVPPDLLAEQPGATFTDRLRRDLGASAAVRLRLPVVDQTARPSAEAREAALAADVVRSGAEADRERAGMLALLARWRVAFQLVLAARQTRARAEANLLRVKSLYSAGGTPLLELLDARRTAEEARRRLADARMESRMLEFEAGDRR